MDITIQETEDTSRFIVEGSDNYLQLEKPFQEIKDECLSYAIRNTLNETHATGGKVFRFQCDFHVVKQMMCDLIFLDR